ncbi:hypothetical protein ENKNEFLB_03892 [Nocardioides aquaticus]|uniref:Uncharacterized protein n=1 Tax=Nocardioides aquaticus TaxID=160826 RepID=A0ABX8EQ38_9ACTN|nr:hypothetical protein ENKNEFLB_03892 [Nocardioides aquaticus]
MSFSTRFCAVPGVPRFGRLINSPFTFEGGANDESADSATRAIDVLSARDRGARNTASSGHVRRSGAATPIAVERCQHPRDLRGVFGVSVRRAKVQDGEHADGCDLGCRRRHVAQSSPQTWGHQYDAFTAAAAAAAAVAATVEATDRPMVLRYQLGVGRAAGLGAPLPRGVPLEPTGAAQDRNLDRRSEHRRARPRRTRAGERSGRANRLVVEPCWDLSAGPPACRHYPAGGFPSGCLPRSRSGASTSNYRSERGCARGPRGHPWPTNRSPAARAERPGVGP